LFQKVGVPIFVSFRSLGARSSARIEAPKAPLAPRGVRAGTPLQKVGVAYSPYPPKVTPTVRSIRS